MWEGVAARCSAVACVTMLSDKEEVVVFLCCGLEAHWVWDCVMLNPGQWDRRTFVRAGRLMTGWGHPSRVIHGPFMWLFWTGHRPFQSCTATKSWCDLLWGILYSRIGLGNFWSCALLLNAQLEVKGEQDVTRWSVLLSPVGGEGRIFTYRCAYSIYGVWNWGFFLMFCCMCPQM